ncbi:MAG TPA: hypothetical protein VGG24_08795 [Paraburkholderia sp.]
MSTGGIITVSRGVHAGASLLLTDGEETVIGNGGDASFVLIDEGVVARHASVRQTGSRLKLTALHDGVQVFGHALAPGKTTLLRQGASFTIGDACLQFSGRDAMTPDAARSAELAWLMTHAPLAWIAKRWALVSRGAKLTLGIALMVAGVAAVWQAYGTHVVASRTPKLDGAFRYVRVREDPKTHANLYEGYVSNPADLSSLVAAVRRDGCSAVMHVVVVDQMKEQLADLLAKYYRGAQLTPGMPGVFTVVAPSEDGYLLPESWDYARVARAAYESVNGLRNLEFEGHAMDGGPVHAPLSAIGMNLARSAHSAWLVDARGVRYFQGAQLPLGRIASISGCTATIVRDDDGTPYELSVRGGDGEKMCN